MKTVLEIISEDGAAPPNFVRVRLATDLSGNSEFKQETILHQKKMRGFFDLFMKSLITGKTLVFETGGDIGGIPKSKAE